MHPTPHRSQVTRKDTTAEKKTACFKNLSWLTYRWDGRFLAGVGLWFYARQAPKLEDDKLNATVSSKLYDINNEIFEDLGAEKRELIQPNDVPQLLKDAIVSVEDRRFYKHIGVDPIRIIGSALSNVKMVDYKAEVP